MTDKPKVAFYWNASCGGCEEAVVDLAEGILKVVEAVDIVFWPVAMDFKKKDVEALPDGEIAVSFINGGVRTSEQMEMAELLRKKSRLVVAFGACAHLGGVPGLANFFDRQSIFERAYLTTPSTANPERVLPGVATRVKEGELTLPEFFDTLRTLDQSIAVDYYLPGCAPPPDLIMKALTAILKGELPAQGSVLAPEKALCDACPLRDSKPEKMVITKIKRVHEVEHDPKKCFLAEGIICLGPATRSGCGDPPRCISANMPCRGCFGPTGEVVDMGAKMLSALASTIDAGSEEEEARILEEIVDPGGIFYMYCLPSSLLRRKRLPLEQK